MKKFVSYILFLVFSFFISSGMLIAEAHAQAANGASSGALITSVMEQVGYHAQAQALVDLKEMFNIFGGLVYLGVLMSMILTVAMMGQYKAALWALVGPAMFIWCSGIEIGGSKNTINNAGTEWRFGAFDDTQVGNDKRSIMARPDVGRNGEVSFLFHKYNELISEIVQKGINVITDKKIRPQMMFMARQRTLESLLGNQIYNAGLKGLMGFFVGHCAEEIGYGQKLAVAMRDPDYKNDPEFQHAEKEYCRLFPKANKPFPPGPWQEYVYDNKFWDGTEVPAEENRTKLKSDHGLVSCRDLWQWVRKGTKQTVLSSMEMDAVTNVSGPAWKMTGQATWEEVLKSLREFLTSDKEVSDSSKGPGDPCPGASGAEDTLDVNAADWEVLANIFTGFVIKKEIINTPTEWMMKNVLDGHGHILPKGARPLKLRSPQEKDDVLRRQGAHQFSKARKYEAYVLLTLLPYIQGVVLYVLAVTYPFFAFLLLLPGQAGQFFSWMALWAWAKCWDLGWAMVIVADEVIWQLMPKTVYINPLNPAPYSSPISLMEGAFEGDHSYTMATYWLLLSGMITAVPIVSAQAILGTKKAVANLILSGITDFSQTVGTGATDWVGAQQTRAYTAERERIQSRNVIRQGLAHFSAVQQDSDAIEQVFKAGLLEAAIQGIELTDGYKTTLRDVVAANAELLSLQASGATAKQIAAQEAKIKSLDAKMKSNAKQVKAGQAREALNIKMKGRHMTADAAAYDPTGSISRLISGRKRRMSQGEVIQWRDAGASKLIAKAIGRKDLKDDGNRYADDPEIHDAIMENRANSMLAQVRSYQHSDYAQFKTLASIPAAAAGYGSFGVPGAFDAFRRTNNWAASSNLVHYNYQYQRTKMEMAMQERVGEVARYESVFSPDWMAIETSRAYVSENRGEWMFMPDAPVHAYWQLQQMRHEADNEYMRLEGYSGGAYERYLLDMGQKYLTK